MLAQVRGEPAGGGLWAMAALKASALGRCWPTPPAAGTRPPGWPQAAGQMRRRSQVGRPSTRAVRAKASGAQGVDAADLPPGSDGSPS